MERKNTEFRWEDERKRYFLEELSVDERIMNVQEVDEGTAVAQRLRYCATNRKVAGSIPDGVVGFFHRHNPSDRTMALGSTQPLTEMSTRSISWGKGGRCVRLTTLPPSCAVVM
jgi:hypothetical protein